MTFASYLFNSFFNFAPGKSFDYKAPHALRGTPKRGHYSRKTPSRAKKLFRLFKGHRA